MRIIIRRRFGPDSFVLIGITIFEARAYKLSVSDEEK
jgi:hypothetical protein